jgi:hypothetical protein
MAALLMTAVSTALAAQTATAPRPHEPTSYSITLVTSDTGSHVLGEVETGWRLRTVEPVEMELDSALRVIRVLVDGKPNTAFAPAYSAEGNEVVVPRRAGRHARLACATTASAWPRGATARRAGGPPAASGSG